MGIYYFKDGEFRFFTAMYGSWNNDKRIVFRVRTDTTTEATAKENQIVNYDRIVKSSDEEIKTWLSENPQFELI